MGLIYDEHLSIDTGLDLDGAVSKLSQAVEPHPTRRGYSRAGNAFDSLGRFHGVITAEGFDVSRRVWPWGSGMLSARGVFSAGRGGVRVNIRMAPPTEVRVFAAVWYGILLLVLVASVSSWAAGWSSGSGAAGAIGFGLIFYLRFLFSWLRERRKAVRFFRAVYMG